jgi:hypothetical protein
VWQQVTARADFAHGAGELEMHDLTDVHARSTDVELDQPRLDDPDHGASGERRQVGV